MNKTRQEIIEELKLTDDEICFIQFAVEDANKETPADIKEEYGKSVRDAQLNKILSHKNVAIVDREVELPFPGEGMLARLNYKVDLLSPARGSVLEAYRLAQQDMLEAGYLKEIK